MKFLTTLALVALYSVQAFGEESFPEPFGLRWGMSESELSNLGFTKSSESSGLNILTSVSAPKAWSKGEMYAALTHKGKLVKVMVSSVDITDDILGSEGKELYSHMKSLLEKKYGPPSTNYEIIGKKLYDDYDELYQCLDYSGCGAYMSIFKFAGGVIAIQLKGKRRGEGFLTISYESPGFSIAKEEIKSGNMESDEEAF